MPEPTEDRRAVRQRRLFALLDRQDEFEALDALIYTFRPVAQPAPLNETALVLDSSVLLRLGFHADVVDYLNTAHTAPSILPGQAIQEFWNNHLQVVESIATAIRRRFDSLKVEVAKVDSTFQDFSNRFEALLEEFRGTCGYAYDGATIHRTTALLEDIKRKAIVSYAPRILFGSMAAQRKRTKTPPGFKDEGDGDFFVWIDTLLALIEAQEAGACLFQSSSRITG